MNRGAVRPEVWDRLVARAHQPGAAMAAAGHDLYGPIAQPPGTALVIGQVGQSLDGRIATLAGDAQNISGRDGLVHLHRLRALVDAVIVGAKTAVHDNPQLNVRHAKGPNPARVLIDPRGRIPDDRRLFRDDGARRIVIQAVDRPRPEGVEVIRLGLDGDIIAPHRIVAALAAAGLTRLLVEGGATTLGHFCSANLIDRLHIAVAPLIIGAGPTGLALPPVDALDDCVRPTVTAYDLGSDVVFDCVFHPRERYTMVAE